MSQPTDTRLQRRMNEEEFYEYLDQIDTDFLIGFFGREIRDGVHPDLLMPLLSVLKRARHDDLCFLVTTVVGLDKPADYLARFRRLCPLWEVRS